MQSLTVAAPLSLTLSPSDGAREKTLVSCAFLPSDLDCSQQLSALSPSDGERVRERGDLHLATWKNCILRTAHKFEVPEGRTVCRLPIGDTAD